MQRLLKITQWRWQTSFLMLSLWYFNNDWFFRPTIFGNGPTNISYKNVTRLKGEIVKWCTLSIETIENHKQNWISITKCVLICGRQLHMNSCFHSFVLSFLLSLNKSDALNCAVLNILEIIDLKSDHRILKLTEMKSHWDWQWNFKPTIFITTNYESLFTTSGNQWKVQTSRVVALSMSIEAIKLGTFKLLISIRKLVFAYI